MRVPSPWATSAVSGLSQFLVRAYKSKAKQLYFQGSIISSGSHLTLYKRVSGIGTASRRMEGRLKVRFCCTTVSFYVWLSRPSHAELDACLDAPNPVKASIRRTKVKISETGEVTAVRSEPIAVQA
jgi:hypothetical protein